MYQTDRLEPHFEGPDVFLARLLFPFHKGGGDLLDARDHLGPRH
jgi:hypothetical protein